MQLGGQITATLINMLTVFSEYADREVCQTEDNEVVSVDYISCLAVQPGGGLLAVLFTVKSMHDNAI